MDWLERLNRGPGRIPMGQGTAELLNWAHQDHLSDNTPHRHTFFEVCLVGEHGDGQFVVGGRGHRLTPGTVFFARPGVVHQIVNTASPHMELFWVCFQWLPSSGEKIGELDRLWRSFAESSTVTIADANGRLAAQWRALRALSDAELYRGYEAQAAALVTALLLTIAQSGAGPDSGPVGEAPGPDAGDVAARLAVRYVHDNLARPLSASEVAGQVHTSPRHLSRLFQRFTGASPAAYITHARMDRAAGLLAHTDTPIKEVAAAVGYPDVHHFTRAFAHHFGLPPGEYRRRPDSRPGPNIQKPGELV